MAEDIKLKIIKILDGIDEENILMQVMEDVAFYAAEKDIKQLLISEYLHKIFPQNFHRLHRFLKPHGLYNQPINPHNYSPLDEENLPVLSAQSTQSLPTLQSFFQGFLHPTTFPINQ
jgi:hypothetical protein